MHAYYYLLLSDLTMKITANSRQTSPHMSYMTSPHMSYIKKITCIPLTKKIHNRNAQVLTDGNSTTLTTVKNKLALHKIPLDGAFVRANIYIIIKYCYYISGGGNIIHK